MGLTLYLGIERGNIACHKSEARFGTLLREGRLASRAFRDEAFWRSQVNFGPPNPATDEKGPMVWSKGKRVRCHTPCLPKNALLDLYSRKLYRQQRARVDPGLTFNYFFHDERTASASVEVVEGPLSQRESFCASLQERRFGPLPYVSQFQLWTIPQQRLPLDRNGSNPDMGIGAFD
ncbi:hypothetical protein L1887_54173 [Cichorium endivia]|nr:hypothetical protein L1887_54173 [Cichorium endivia]